VMQCAALADDARFSSNPRRVANRAGLDSIIEERFRKLLRAEVQQLLDAAGIASGDVNDVPAVARHPQLQARGRWGDVDSPAGSIPALVPPHNLLHAPARMGRVPALGEHTQEILQELADAP
jgi:itaconate CoA-transferase